jgi:CHRD domain
MRKLVLAALAATTAGVIAVGPAVAASGGTPKTFTVHMTGSQEVPKGSPTGSGTFQYQLLPSQGVLCFSLKWSKIDTPTASHIHKATKGKAGNVVIVLFGKAPVGHSGCRKASKSLLTAIGKHPKDYYVNVHTKKYPNGAIRGQLG